MHARCWRICWRAGRRPAGCHGRARRILGAGRRARGARPWRGPRRGGGGRAEGGGGGHARACWLCILSLLPARRWRRLLWPVAWEWHAGAGAPVATPSLGSRAPATSRLVRVLPPRPSPRPHFPPPASLWRLGPRTVGRKASQAGPAPRAAGRRAYPAACGCLKHQQQAAGTSTWTTRRRDAPVGGTLDQPQVDQPTCRPVPAARPSSS